MSSNRRKKETLDREANLSEVMRQWDNLLDNEVFEESEKFEKCVEFCVKFGAKDPRIDLVRDIETDEDLNVTAVNITLQKSAIYNETVEFACL